MLHLLHRTWHVAAAGPVENEQKSHGMRGTVVGQEDFYKVGSVSPFFAQFTVKKVSIKRQLDA